MRTPLAVVGAVTASFVGAKLLRQALVWAQYTLLPPVVCQYAGEWALVTGGSEGIGKAVAAELAGYGLNVVLVSRSQNKLNAAAAEIRTKHPTVQVKTYAADLVDTSSYSKLLQHLTDSNIHVSVLIANAGGVPNPAGVMKPYWEISEADETQTMNLNGHSCYSLVHGLLPAMVARRKGAVVCISSVASRMTAFMAPYGSEKAKMNALCEALDVELQGTGVTAQAMVLGMVITPAVMRFMKPAAADNSGSSSSPEAAAAAAGSSSDDHAVIKPGVLTPSAETAAAAIVRSIGRGGPVVTPYWGHSVHQALVFGWWPPELQRTVVAAVTRSFMAKGRSQEKKAA